VNRPLRVLLERSKTDPVMSVDELQRWSGYENKKSLSVVLARLTKQKLVEKVGCGLYCLPNAELTLQQIADRLVRHAYSTASYVLSKYGVLDQQCFALTLASLTQSRKYATSRGRIVVHQIAPRLWTGFDPFTREACTEKAFLDAIYFGRKNDRNFRLSGNYNAGMLSMKRLRQLGRLFPPEVYAYAEKCAMAARPERKPAAPALPER
jgi:hypothetical protein